MSIASNRLSFLAAVAALATAPAAQAITFELDLWDGVDGTLNSMLTAGAGIRMQDRAFDLVGKANLNPGVCGGIAQACQGVFRDQSHPAETLAASPGQAFLNADDGNLNYDEHDLTQAVFKVTQDLSLSYGDYGLFAKWLYFYDFVNNDFTEYHPNWITAANEADVGCPGASGCQNVTSYDRAYGPGAVVRSKRTDPETLRQIGTDLQLFDFYIFGTNFIPGTDSEKSFTWKLGRQTLNWGESTALVINSINQVNPVNVNNLYRVGFDLSELYMPTGMLYLSTETSENSTVEMFYGYEWGAVEIPAPGSFFSFADLGTNNAMDYASISFGGPAEEPDICGTGSKDPEDPFQYYNPNSGCGSPQNNPLSGLTNTSLRIQRLRDKEPSGGEFGLAFKYFAENLNNGTQFGFYFMNYHSKLPYVSFYSTAASCARAEGNDGLGHNGTGADATNGLELLALCDDADTPLPTDLPLTNTTAEGARAATRNAVPIDTVRYQVEYPENIQLYGVSFNTTVGDFSIQGELAFRPDMPLQVDLQDLTFHALGPMLARCHDPLNSSPCQGTTSGLSQVDGQAYGSSDFIPYPDWAERFPEYAEAIALNPTLASTEGGYKDTFDLGIGAGVGSARSFPSFIGAYRGVAAGETRPRSYIRGWEKFDVWQANLGGTYVQGVTDNVIGADQLIWLFEMGAQYVPDLPDTSRLQIETPGTHYHASAGADGSMTGNYAQDCSHTPDCNFGADGLRFNPHQEDADGYADRFSAGYVIVSLIRYESVFPGISFAPLTIFQHDVVGTSTDVAAQFVERRKDISLQFEIRYKESLSVVPGYQWFTGGGQYNLVRDRDQASLYLKYLF